MLVRRKLASSDSGVAGVIGVILILAVVITAYANAIRTDLPKFGAEGEHAWDRSTGDRLTQFTRALAEGLTAGAPLATIVEGPPKPRGVDVPLLGHAEPFAASGTIAFVPECASFSGDHTLASGVRIEDLRASAGGCLSFQAAPVYSPAFAYRVELGGMLRVQGDRAVVLSGPSLELDASNPNSYRVAIGVPGLRGDSTTTSVGATNARVDLVPGPFSVEVERSPNAASAEWRLRTAYPTAWKAWYETRLEQAGFLPVRSSPGPGGSSSDYSVVCAPVDCAQDAQGLGTVVVRIEGPRVDGDDLRLSLSYGIFDVNLR